MKSEDYNYIYFAYEVIIYWKDTNGKIKTFYKIGHSSSRNNDIYLASRFKSEIEKDIKIFIVNVKECHTRKIAQIEEEKWFKKALEINHIEFEPIYDDEIGIEADFGDFYDYPYYFAGSTEVMRTPIRFKSLVNKLSKYFDSNPSVYCPKKFNNYLEKEVQ